MIKVSVLYPNIENRKFNMNYYCNNHVPMVQKKLGAACKRISIERGLSGPVPESQAAYIVMGHLYFDSIESFQAAFNPFAEEIMQDISNYTDIQPTVQISNVEIEYP